MMLVGAVCGATIAPVKIVAAQVGEFFKAVSFVAGGAVHAGVPPESENKLSVQLLETDPAWLGLIFIVPILYWLIWRKV